MAGISFLFKKIFVRKNFSIIQERIFYIVYIFLYTFKRRTNCWRPFACRDTRDVGRYGCFYLGRMWNFIGRCRRQPRSVKSTQSRESARPKPARESDVVHGVEHDPPLSQRSQPPPPRYYLEDDVLFVISRRAISIITSRRGRVYPEEMRMSREQNIIERTNFMDGSRRIYCHQRDRFMLYFR